MSQWFKFIPWETLLDDASVNTLTVLIPNSQSRQTVLYFLKIRMRLIVRQLCLWIAGFSYWISAYPRSTRYICQVGRTINRKLVYLRLYFLFPPWSAVIVRYSAICLVQRYKVVLLLLEQKTSSFASMNRSMANNARNIVWEKHLDVFLLNCKGSVV